MQKISFLCMGGWVEYTLKGAEQNRKKKPGITLVFKLKTVVICIEYDLDEDI